ncbi:hypothetical protein AEA42_05385, partial [Shewanella sp. Sh95]
GALQFADGTPATGYSYNATTGVISWTETAPGEGGSITVTATQTDAANNTSPPSPLISSCVSGPSAGLPSSTIDKDG